MSAKEQSNEGLNDRDVEFYYRPGTCFLVFEASIRGTEMLGFVFWYLSLCIISLCRVYDFLSDLCHFFLSLMIKS
jgi:hypothetical protein